MFGMRLVHDVMKAHNHLRGGGADEIEIVRYALTTGLERETSNPRPDEIGMTSPLLLFIVQDTGIFGQKWERG